MPYALMSEARNPTRIKPGAIVITADEGDSVFARFHSLTQRGRHTVVYLELLPGNPLTTPMRCNVRISLDMTEHPRTEMTLPADLNQVDDTGYVWTFLSAAANPGSITPGALLVAGDDVGPFLARVVDMIDGPGGDSIVHLDVVGVPTI